MAYVRVEHSAVYTYNDTSGNGEPQHFTSEMLTVAGTEEIPESKWQLVGKYGRHNPSTTDRKFYASVVLENFADFENRNCVAFGTAHLRFTSYADYDYASSESDCHHCDLPEIHLNALKENTVWSPYSIEVSWRRSITFDLRVDITLIYNKPAPAPDNMKILGDLLGLFENELHSDLVLVADDKSIKVHKSVLAARSAVFQRMFDTDMRENRENKVVIEDMKSDVLLNMIKFMYTGTYEDSEQPGFIEDLYVATDRYEVSDLKEIVRKKLCEGISVANIGRRFLLGDQFKEHLLRQKCVAFIRDNSAALSNQEEAIFFS